MEYFDKHGFDQPLIVDKKDGLGLKVPLKDFSIADVERCVGEYISYVPAVGSLLKESPYRVVGSKYRVCLATKVRPSKCWLTCKALLCISLWLCLSLSVCPM